MKYIDKFRDGRLAKGIAAAIAREVAPQRQYAFMEFYGGHTHAIRGGDPHFMAGMGCGAAD